MPERGQSEVVGFVLIFGVILLGITLVAAVGDAGLDNAREYERTRTAQGAFTVLADNLDDVTAGGVPSRTTELRLADAKLALGDPTTVSVHGEATGDSDDTFDHTETVRPIVYDDGDGTTIAYSSGAVVRTDGVDSVVLRDPNVVLSADAVVLPIVRTRAEGVEATGTGGNPTVDVRAERTNATPVVVSDAGYDVTLEVTSPRAAAWARSLESAPDVDCTLTGQTVSCSVETERVRIVSYLVDVRFG